MSVHRNTHWLMWFIALFLFVLFTIPFISSPIFILITLLLFFIGGYRILNWSVNPHNNKQPIITDTGRFMPERRSQRKIPLTQPYKNNTYQQMDRGNRFCFECGMKLTPKSQSCGGCGTQIN